MKRIVCYFFSEKKIYYSILIIYKNNLFARIEFLANRHNSKFFFCFLFFLSVLIKVKSGRETLHSLYFPSVRSDQALRSPRDHVCTATTFAHDKCTALMMPVPQINGRSPVPTTTRTRGDAHAPKHFIVTLPHLPLSICVTRGTHMCGSRSSSLGKFCLHQV